MTTLLISDIGYRDSRRVREYIVDIFIRAMTATRMKRRLSSLEIRLAGSESAPLATNQRSIRPRERSSLAHFAPSFLAPRYFRPFFLFPRHFPPIRSSANPHLHLHSLPTQTPPPFLFSSDPLNTISTFCSLIHSFEVWYIIYSSAVHCRFNSKCSLANRPDQANLLCCSRRKHPLPLSQPHRPKYLDHSAPSSCIVIAMAAFYYNAQHNQTSSHSSSHNHHGGRSRRAPRLSASQNSHRQFRGVRSMKELAESQPASAFRVRFEAGRSFDLDDDLEFCPGLLTDDDVSHHEISSASGDERLP